MNSWRDVVCNGRCMTATRDRIKMFSFSVMQTTFCFSSVEILFVLPIYIVKQNVDCISRMQNYIEKHAGSRKPISSRSISGN